MPFFLKMEVFDARTPDHTAPNCGDIYMEFQRSLDTLGFPVSDYSVEAELGGSCGIGETLKLYLEE
jgi:hypothetical protein